ncbi:MarR family winged helix-turn-helix transcriptional regulator [Dehalococcoides mccartyi]|uniref:Transcriptional regulator, MarR family n=1 Tax=Dehalococcoides mccartyi (strain VS) TaxID=311424 RepID=D2BJ65_DEHMV|nr:MarR family transcriptional regulator [Dehalococcoides mccartyi]ACZ62365.1 transcriptional regulator, MarR family [Dehalococcoides mccartyi VS]
MTHRLRKDGYKIWSILMQARTAAYHVRRKDLMEYGVSPEQAGILERLYHTKDKTMTPTRIAEIFLRQPNTITAILRGMERKGLVELSKDLERKNMIRVTITGKGTQLREIINTNLAETRKIFDVLSDEELELLENMLLRIRDKSITQTSSSKYNAKRKLEQIHESDSQIL